MDPAPFPSRKKLESPSAERNKGPIWDVIRSRILGDGAGGAGDDDAGGGDAFKVLEVAAGAGVHTRHFVREYLRLARRPGGPRWPPLAWCPTDPSPEGLASQRAYRDDGDGAGAGGEEGDDDPDGTFREMYRGSIRDPLFLTLDEGGVQEAGTFRALREVAPGGFDLILCVNMVHIAPWGAAVGLFRAASRLLKQGGGGGGGGGGRGGVLLVYGPFRVNGTMVESNQRFDAWLRAQDPRHGVRDLEDVQALAEGAGLELAEAVEMPANNLAALFRPKKASKGPGPRP